MRKRSRSGMIWIEAVLAVGAMAMVVVLAMRGLHGLLGIWGREAAALREEAELTSLVNTVQRQLDQMAEHRFLDEPGLLLDGPREEGRLTLERIRIRSQTEAGTLLWWELEWSREGWRFGLEGTGAPHGGLRYSGRIVIRGPLGKEAGSGILDIWSFPESVSVRARKGFPVCQVR